MKLYTVTKEYLNHVYDIDEKVLKSKMTIGFIVRQNGFIYFVPLERADETDYQGNGSVKRSTPAIFRMFERDTGELIGKCLFSNMFPVPYHEIVSLDLTDFPEDVIALIEKQNKFIQANEKRLEKSVSRLYKQKIKNYDQPYLKTTIDFQKMEKECIAYEIQKYGKHLNRFPDSQYFIVNPFQSGQSEYYFMNRHEKIARVLMNNETQNIIAILETYKEEYAPLECFENGELTSASVSAWFRSRGIPSWRDGLGDFLEKAGIETEILLLNKAYGLSLSDQYWMNPVQQQLNWDDINFFQHDFNSSDFIEASFENKVKENVDLYTPNNTSDGMLKKAWITGDDHKRYLLKGSYRQSGFEPFCEVLASKICAVLDVPHVEYTINYLSSSVVSKCECFVQQTNEFISAYAILKYENVEYKKLDASEIYRFYISILEKHGLTEIRKNLAKMFICDYLIVNEDRHLGNFGIIRNVEDLKWIAMAPVFDSGQAMYSQSKIYEMNFGKAYGTFFNEKHMDFERILEIVLKDSDIDIALDLLRKTVKEWKDLLIEHQDRIHITDERIKACVDGLYTRIDKLEDFLSLSK